MQRIALCVLAGVVLVQLLPELPDAASVAFPLAVMLVAGAVLLAARVRALGPVALLLVPALAGALWATWRAQRVMDDRLDAALENRSMVIEGVVVSIPGEEAGRVQFDFAPTACDAGCPLPQRVRLAWYDAAQRPRAGERWRLEARLREPRGFANPGGFDYERQLFREGVGATGSVRDSAHNRRLELADGSRPVLGARALIAQRISRALGDSPATGVLSGLAVGATSAIPAPQWDVFSNTGTTHLIAISGLHVTMLAGLAMVAGNLLWWAWPQPTRLARQDFASLLGAATAIGYSALAGFSVPTQRTLVMLLVAYAVGWLRRPLRSTQTLGLALLAVLFVDPQAALAPGFWLSFAAVAAILLTGVADASRLWEFLRTQGVVTVALAPATLALFGSFSFIAPLANLFAIPLFSLLLVPMTLLAVAVQSAVEPAGDALLRLTAHVFEVGWPILEWLAGWRGALVHLPPPAVAVTCGLAVAALMALLPLPLRWRAIGFAMALPLLWPGRGAPPIGAAQVDVLDVGQGLAVVVRTYRHTLLYDTGPAFRSGRSAADLAVLPFLRDRGVQRLDLLVLSHADNDHAGGAGAIARALDVVSVRHGGPAPRLGVPAAPCLAGEAWTWDGVGFEFLHPRAGETWRDNDGSCVLRIVAAGQVLLLTGDIERAAEHALRSRGLPGGADVIVVPHHGSASSSTAELVGSVRAAFAVVSAGHGNRWRFPQAPVVERWCAQGAEVIETSQWGAIALRLGAGSELRPEAFRVLERRYWRARTPYAGVSRCAGPAPVSSGANCSSGGSREACGKSSRQAARSCGRSYCARSAPRQSCWNGSGHCGASACCRPSSPTRCGSGSARTRSMTS